MNELLTTCDDECDRDEIDDDDDMFIVMTTCFLLSYLVQFAASITLTANTLIDAVGSSIRSVSTSSAAVESYKRPPNSENYWLGYPGMTFFWLFVLFVGVIFYALHHAYYKVGDSTEDPQMAEQKDQQQQQQSTNIVSKRECFYISISYRI